MRTTVALLCALALLALGACGGGDGDGYGCTGSTCRATFEGPGEQDLSSDLGDGATVEVVTVDQGSVTARIAGKDAKLVTNEEQRVGSYDVTLRKIDGDNVTLRVVGR